ncbi:STAS domain-containing protein [Streptomyces sp. NPDC057616]|uniref:STAS domain-containing protein n=1 Tax=Streptomyces sp. NPDC057616 TaxID=3346183 RepID=UPI0036BF4290
MTATAIDPVLDPPAGPTHLPQEAEHLRISLSHTGGGAMVRLAGELDIAGAPALTALLAHCVEQGRDIAVDAADLTFIDAAGIRPLADAQARCRRQGRSFRLRTASAAVRRVVTLTGLADRLFGTADAARTVLA